jgi:hypothetical protein
MAYVPLADAGRQATGGHIAATSLLTTVTASATVNAVGSWVQLHASVGFPVHRLQLFTGGAGIAVSASNAQVLVDIGIGASGSETVLVSDVAIGGTQPFVTIEVPIGAPAGTRLAVRIRSAVASKSCTMGMTVYGGGVGLECGHRATTYGAVTAGSRGTALTLPGAVNAKAAWTVLSTATTGAARWVVIGVGLPNIATVLATTGLLDIGVGAAAAESTIIADIPFVTTTGELIAYPNPLTYPVTLPAGVRLVARYQSVSTAAGGQIGVTVTGIH